MYPDGRLTLADLRAELPFPTKIVTVQMPGSVLQAALRWSRTMPLEATSRRGYLQVRFRFVHILVGISRMFPYVEYGYQLYVRGTEYIIYTFFLSFHCLIIAMYSVMTGLNLTRGRGRKKNIRSRRSSGVAKNSNYVAFTVSPCLVIYLQDSVKLSLSFRGLLT